VARWQQTGGEHGEMDEDNERQHILSLLYAAQYTWRAHVRRTACGRRSLARGAAGAGVRVGAAHAMGTGGGNQAWGRSIAEAPKHPYAGGISGRRVARPATTSMVRERADRPCLFPFTLLRNCITPKSDN
jgi:hypothetical protein